MASRLYYVHGSGYTQDSFRDQVAAFPGSDALSLPGHPEGEPLAAVGDLAEWLDAYVLWSGARKAVVAGNSLGGAIAMEWALRHPDRVAGLILIGTGARLKVGPAIFDMLNNDWPACIPKFADYAVSADAPSELRERVEQWHRTVGQKATRADYAACNEFDIMARLPEIKAPTLILVGGEDALTPPKYARYLNEHIAGSKLVEVPGAGHIVMAQRPDLVNPAIEAFLRTMR
jgi:pimeloyl-ACP methyl ester carboxylesterase